MVDDERGTWVEDAAGDCVVFDGPDGEPAPGVDAPGVAAFDVLDGFRESLEEEECASVFELLRIYA